MSYVQNEADMLTQARADLIANIAKGIKSATINGESVVFDSFEAMRARLQWIDAQLTGLSGGAARVSYPRTTRGL